MNGKPSGSSQRINVPLPTTPVPCTFGAAEPEHYPFDGTIDEARISKIARYDRGFTPPPTFISDDDTIALYRFEEGEGDALIDLSGNNRHGKIFAADWITLNPQRSLPAAKGTPPAAKMKAEGTKAP